MIKSPMRRQIGSKHVSEKICSLLTSFGFWGPVAMIFFGAALRVLPHPPNFSPLAAMALFGGAVFARRELGALIPLAALFLSDCYLGFHDQMIAVYGAMALVSLLGWWVKPNLSAVRVVGAALAASVLFYLITNAAVWLTGEMYAKTFGGLALCMTAGLPFLQNSLLGDLFYTGVFFGAWALATKAMPQQKYV